MRALCGSLLVLSLLAPATVARAGTPTDQLKAGVDRILAVFHDPNLQEDADHRRAAVRKISAALFDFHEMARRTLGRYWDARTPDEKDDFTERLGTLVARQLALLDGHGGDAVQFVGESIDGDQATVETRVVPTQGRAIALDYRLVRRADRWLVYDVVFENASLLGNYRSQFQRVLRTTSYDALIQKLSR